jgi:hypothetical protein
MAHARPATIINPPPRRAARRDSFSASPRFLVGTNATGRKRFNSASVRCLSVPDPAIGLKIMNGFTSRGEIAQRLSIFDGSAQHFRF